jgi:hypothetical protein
MEYKKTSWLTTTRISAEALNHLETQYDDVLSTSSDWNNHDTLYYTKPLAITTFFNTSFMGPNSHSDADLLDGHHASELMGAGLPVGSIIWWSKVTMPPQGTWGVCDGGTYGGVVTGNYSNKFIIGVSGTYTVGNSYGSNTTTPTSASVSIGGTVLDATTMASHRHVWSETHGVPVTNPYSGYGDTGTNGSFVYYSSTTAARTTDAAGSGGSHTHTGSSVTFQSESNIPPYCALYLIQRVA